MQKNHLHKDTTDFATRGCSFTIVKVTVCLHIIYNSLLWVLPCLQGQKCPQSLKRLCSLVIWLFYIIHVRLTVLFTQAVWWTQLPAEQQLHLCLRTMHSGTVPSVGQLHVLSAQELNTQSLLWRFIGNGLAATLAVAAATCFACSSLFHWLTGAKKCCQRRRRSLKLVHIHVYDAGFKMLVKTYLCKCFSRKGHVTL